ncbi:MAG: hypothetical protein FJX18_03090 [Alphaproteobacteria bacterium]|nr:hypothetical protein [Alphaproteobacteria bacterium]
MIYFAWIDPETPFNLEALSLIEEDLLGVKIHHREGGFPSARVVIARTDKTPEPLPHHAVLYYEKMDQRFLLFKGSLVMAPLKRQDRCLILEFTTETDDTKPLLQIDQRALKTLPFFDPLFVDPLHSNDLDEILEAYTRLPHWDRTGSFCFSDIISGSKTINLGGNFDQKSLKTKLLKKPLGSLSFEITAQWIQEFSGLINLSPSIMNALPDRMISTLTPHYLQKHWWKVDHSLAQTAYKIVQSDLIPFDPTVGGVEGRFSSLSSAFHIDDRFPVYVPRFWFLPHLVVQCNYRQKRSESVSVTVPSPFNLSPGNSLEKKIRLTLQNVRKDTQTPLWRAGEDYRAMDCVQKDGCHYECHDDHTASRRFDMDESYWSRTFFDKSPLTNQAASSYFLSPRGEESIIHAVERAWAYLVAGARVMEITFETSFFSIEDIDCDTTITIEDPRLPGGKISGKVAGYKILFKQGVSTARIRLLATSERRTCLPATYQEIWKQTPSGVLLGKPESKSPIQGILDPRLLTGDDIFKRLKTIDSPEEQNALLFDKTFPSLKEAERAVATHPTRFCLELLPLNQQKKLHHEIKIPVVGHAKCQN